MEPKRALTSVDLAALVGELGRYEGAKVDKAYLYGEDLLRLRMRDFDRGRVELLIEVGERKRAHTADPAHVPDAPGRPPEFAMMLRSRISGADFAGVTQHGFDRILTFAFERDDEDTAIVAELFGEGNLAVLDETGAVVRSLETVRLKSRTVAPGAQYEYPEARSNPLAMGRDALARQMAASDTDVVRTLATQLDLGGLWAEELCTRAGVEKTLPIEEAGEDVYDRLDAELDALAATISGGDLDPRVYLEEGTVVDATPVPLREHEGLDADPHDAFTAALDDYFHRLDRAEATAEADRERPDFESQIATQERIVDQQEGAIEEFAERADRERRRAELLYAHYDLVDEVLTTVRDARERGAGWEEIEATLEQGADRGIAAAAAVVGVDGEAGTVTLELDDLEVAVEVDAGVEHNADRLYTEAKRIEDKRAGAEAALADTREELAAVRRRREAWDAEDADDDEDNEEDGGPDIDWLAESSLPTRTEDHWYERFRWFHTSDGFLVIGGRDADDNEEIVKKYTDADDLFVHAQAHGGPATVIKATGPSEPARDVDIPQSSREEAAQFAVSYSSVWKDGRFAGDAYLVTPDQVSKTPESGEYLEKGGFAIRGDRTYHRDVEVGVAVGIQCEPETRVVGGPPSAVEPRAETVVRLEPGRYAQNDAAKRVYREFRERFADQSFVRKIASPDLIQEFLPPGGSTIVGE